MLVPFVIRMDDDDTARTDHFWPGGRDDKFFPVLTHPPHVNEFGFPRQALNFGIGDGRSFNRVVDVGPQILDDVAFLEQFNKDGLRDAAVVGASVRYSLSKSQDSPTLLAVSLMAWVKVSIVVSQRFKNSARS